MKMKTRKFSKGMSVLLLSVGLVLSSIALADESRVIQEQKEQPKKWIGDWLPANQKTKVFFDSQHKTTIYPRQWHQDRQGNIYIRSDKTQKWIGKEDIK
jgi:hypothetical protein